MTSVFIESSALFRAYTREPGSALMDEIFLAMEAHRITGLISQFSVPEIIRGLSRERTLKNSLIRKHKKSSTRFLLILIPVS